MHFQKLLQAVTAWRLFCRTMIFARITSAARFFVFLARNTKKNTHRNNPFNRYSISFQKFFQKVLIFSMFLLDFLKPRFRFQTKL